MTAIGAILAIIGTGIIVSLAIYGGVTVLANVESYFAIRARLKSIGPSEPRDDALGDVPNVPSGFTVFHPSTNKSGAQQSAE